MECKRYGSAIKMDLSAIYSSVMISTRTEVDVSYLSKEMGLVGQDNGLAVFA